LHLIFLPFEMNSGQKVNRIGAIFNEIAITFYVISGAKWKNPPLSGSIAAGSIC